MFKPAFVNEKGRRIVYLSSAGIFLASVIISLIIGKYQFTIYVVPTNSSALLSDDIIAVGILTAILPIAIISFINYRYLQLVERNIPRFLRDILQSTDSGLILPDALIEASKSDYGPISNEIGIAMTKFSFGHSFEESIMEAALRLRHPYAPQVGMILSEAYSAGGKTHEVLSSSVSLFNGLEQYSEQKKSELRPYTQLVYISVGIYLAIALIILTQFMGQLEQIASETKISTSGLAAASAAARQFALNIPALPYFISIFFLSAILESIFAGVVAGKIVEGSALAGLRHSAILIAATIVVFNLLL
jgi:flagellar protein FlaJ